MPNFMYGGDQSVFSGECLATWWTLILQLHLKRDNEDLTYILRGQKLHPSSHLIGETEKIQRRQTFIGVIWEKVLDFTVCCSHTSTECKCVLHP